MKEKEILNALSNLNDDEATRIAEAMFLGETPLGRAVQKYIAANVNSSMILWAARDPATMAQFQEMTGSIIKDAVAETIEQLGNSPELPLRAFYTEAQACRFFQKGPQFFKTRRANGQSVPKHIDTGRGYIYSVAELLRFSDEIGPDHDPISKGILIERGFEAVSFAVESVRSKIDARRKSRVPKKD